MSRTLLACGRSTDAVHFHAVVRDLLETRARGCTSGIDKRGTFKARSIRMANGMYECFYFLPISETLYEGTKTIFPVSKWCVRTLARVRKCGRFTGRQSRTMQDVFYAGGSGGCHDLPTSAPSPQSSSGVHPMQGTGMRFSMHR